MMRYFICAFLLVGLFSCGEKDPTQDLEVVENRDDEGNLTEKYTRRKDNFAKQGQYQAFSSDGKIVEEANYVNDSLHGERKLYYDNGKVELIERYSMNEFEGTYQEFYENEQLKFEGEYVGNTMTGEWKKYYDSGELMELVLFENNEENGPFREYYQNGNIKTKGEYLNGSFEHGLLKKYEENGELSAKMQCLKGICQTIWSKEEGDIEFDETAFQEKVERIKAIEASAENF
ncbi:toxin-antitoxin system YwqK family antitoxin [Saprospiraceae bacterium]|jgi:antitoxin component YwqK of YwqJK toxin-antitoxin module|nr:toxin-antitoxin system YwqK family antitoxin [Bacteroidota bacterium]MDB4727740.1 toxin-antitoxin system YwqK family antitoxin [Saprospiraceae bacterium]MDF1863260.1 toxin-antitoxin system YwqK family antitoxin [Saprospiraceae bacterium]